MLRRQPLTATKAVSYGGFFECVSDKAFKGGHDPAQGRDTEEWIAPDESCPAWETTEGDELSSKASLAKDGNLFRCCGSTKRLCLGPPPKSRFFRLLLRPARGTIIPI